MRFPGVAMRVVLAGGSSAHEKRLQGVLAPYGARVERVVHDSHLHLQLLKGPAASLVVIDATTRRHDDGVKLATELRVRSVHPNQPEIIVLSQTPGHAQALSAFEGGVDGWIAPMQSNVLSAHCHFVHCIHECREHGPRWSEAIAFLEDLPLHSTGIVSMSDGRLTAEVSVREGRVGYVHFNELQTTFSDAIGNEVHTRCPEVDVLRQTLGYPVYDWDRALSEHACWARARLRAALTRRWQQAVRWMAGTRIERIEWRAQDTRFAAELAFEPFGLLSALDEEVPHSYARGRLSFGSPRAENDMLAYPSR